MRTRVTRTFTFDAAHHRPWHAGRCRNLHGHRKRLEAAGTLPLARVEPWATPDPAVELLA